MVPGSLFQQCRISCYSAPYRLQQSHFSKLRAESTILQHTTRWKNGNEGNIKYLS